MQRQAAKVNAVCPSRRRSLRRLARRRGLSTISERELHAGVLRPLCSADHQLGDGVQEVTQTCDQPLICFRQDRGEHEALFNKNGACRYEHFNLKATEGLKNSPV